MLCIFLLANTEQPSGQQKLNQNIMSQVPYSDLSHKILYLNVLISIFNFSFALHLTATGSLLIFTGV